MEIEIKIPPAFNGICEPHRYKVYYGGRGAAKSWAVASALLAISLQKQCRILCTRELQKSIADSVHRLLLDMIYRYHLENYFTVTQTSVTSIIGSEFIFAGLRSNIGEIKSMEGIDICWVEEAQKVSENSWRVLIPTIRTDGSEIWVTFNPVDDTDPTYKRFITNPPWDALIQKVSWRDNPYFPETLLKELEYDKRIDHEKYLHVWEGETRKISEALVFAGKWAVDVFDAPVGTVYYYGADWGFSQDPSVLIRCFIQENKLYIENEAYGVGVDIDKTPEMFDTVPDARKWEIVADSARPETISYMVRNGFKMRSAMKGAGSVEDGIAHLRSFEKIIVHERCIHTAYELANYSYKVNKLSGQVMPILEDAHDHCIDSLRYALEPVMRAKKIPVPQHPSLMRTEKTKSKVRNLPL